MKVTNAPSASLNGEYILKTNLGAKIWKFQKKFLVDCVDGCVYLKNSKEYCLCRETKKQSANVACKAITGEKHSSIMSSASTVASLIPSPESPEPVSVSPGHSLPPIGSTSITSEPSPYNISVGQTSSDQRQVTLETSSAIGQQETVPVKTSSTSTELSTAPTETLPSSEYPWLLSNSTGSSSSNPEPEISSPEPEPSEYPWLLSSSTAKPEPERSSPEPSTSSQSEPEPEGASKPSAEPEPEISSPVPEPSQFPWLLSSSTAKPESSTSTQSESEPEGASNSSAEPEPEISSPEPELESSSELSATSPHSEPEPEGASNPTSEPEPEVVIILGITGFTPTYMALVSTSAASTSSTEPEPEPEGSTPEAEPLIGQPLTVHAGVEIYDGQEGSSTISASGWRAWNLFLKRVGIQY